MGTEVRRSECTVVVSSKVDQFGAEISVQDALSPIAGAKVVLPPGAIVSEQTVSIGYCKNRMEVRTGRVGSIALTLEVSGVQQFKEPVLIKIIYDSHESPSVVIPYRIDEQDHLRLLQIRRFDKEEHSVVFDTFLPGYFVWVYP